MTTTGRSTVKSNGRRRERLASVNAEIREIKEEMRALGLELDDLEKVKSILDRKRERRSPQRKKQGTKPKVRSKRMKSVKAGNSRDRVLRAFREANGGPLTNGDLQQLTGLSTASYHLAALKQERILVSAGLVEDDHGRAVPAYKLNAREVSIKVGDGAREGRKRKLTRVA